VTILRVALDGPLDGLFDYLPPEPLPALELQPGLRLLVPFGRGRRLGILVRLTAESDQPPERLRRVERVLDGHPLLTPRDLDFLHWASAYYQHPLGEVIFSALPARLREPEALLETDLPGVRLSLAGRALAPEELSRAPRQRELLELLRAAPEGLALCQLRERLGESAAALRGLRAKALIEDCRVASDETLAPAGPAAEGPALNPEQAAAVAAVLESRASFRAFLLDGVTGSGKTEVYIRLIAEMLAAGRQTLLLVPEIGLTPQLRERLRARLPGVQVVLHSALNASERERGWRGAASGEAGVVLGTRSAVFTPLPRLGLILVDEEHDASLKQQEGFRYSARDLAVRRAQLAGCPVVLGSATPALETLHNARLGRYAWLHLPQRAGGASAPSIRLLDIRAQPLRAGLSPVLREAMREQLAAGNQVLLFLNRRGYAPLFTCHACGWVGSCPHCDRRLTLHLGERRLWCHHCGWSARLPERCPGCGSEELRMVGRGTERLEEELGALFPDVAVARIDRDSTRRKGELARLLDGVRRGETGILLGTQMLAKGHDFPGVTLVGVLDLDQMLYASDFRAPERAAQLMVQVAGRAGRAERPGRVVLQTRHPEHPLLQSLLAHGYAGFAEAALAEREAAALPPFSYLALARAEAPEAETAMAFLRAAREQAEALGEPRLAVFGPVPAPLERRAGRHRAQLLLQCADRLLMQRLLARWRVALVSLKGGRGLRWSLDVDPQDML